MDLTYLSFCNHLKILASVRTINPTMVLFKNIQPVNVADLPPFKKIKEITVDCFDIPVLNCTHYFLSHFHSDHYTKLSKTFPHPVYCSITTAALVAARIGAVAIGLKMYTTYDLGTFYVKLIEANHCPGAVLFIFLIDSEYYLHTGDFRYSQKFHKFQFEFKAVYLDNTYETFIDLPTQEEAIVKLLEVFDQRNKLCPLNICVLCCTYCVGKEKIFLAISEYLDLQVQVTEDKMAIYNCYDSYTVNRLNSDVKEILNEKRATNKTHGFIKRLQLKKQIKSIIRNKRTNTKSTFITLEPTYVEHKNEKVKMLDNIKLFDYQESHELLSPVSNNKIKRLHTNRIITNQNKNDTEAFEYENMSNITDCTISESSCSIQPFDRLTTDEAPIKVINMNELLSFDTSKIFADKIYIICGTGWKEKHVFKNFKRLDGRLIKQGIEIIHFRYSEHSSANELKAFKKMNYFINVINTVNNKTYLD